MKQFRSPGQEHQNGKPKRIGVYARVSSADQALGTSLQDQQDRSSADAKARCNMAVTKFFVEAESGIGEKHEKRERMQELMAWAREGDLILVDKLDRWSRDTEVTYRSIRELREKGVGIRFVSENFEPGTTMGNAMLGMFSMFANMEHGRIRERMVGTRFLLLEKGYWIHGKCPFGYRRRTLEEAGGDRLLVHKLVVVPEEAKIVKRLFRKYVEGNSTIIELIRDLKIGRNCIFAYLKQKFYAGYLQMPPSATKKKDGEWIKSDHEAIVDIALFEKAQELLKVRKLGGSRRREKGQATYEWILRDVAVCGYCGSKMTSHTPEGRAYYVCRAKKFTYKKDDLFPKSKLPKCDAPHVRVGDVEESAFEEVVARLGELGRELAKPPKTPKVTKPEVDVAAKRAALKAKRHKIQEMFTDGDMTKDERRLALAKLDAEVSKLEALEVTTAKVSPIHEAKTRREMLSQLQALERACGQLDCEEQRNVVNALVTSVEMKAKTLPKRRAFHPSTVVQPPKYNFRSPEEVHERLDLIREQLLKGLGRAPTNANMVDAISRGAADVPH